jgi:tetratricopeptide (TPR) repeat protein
MEDCAICFLPMPYKLISCISLPPATISSVPINDYANANEELVTEKTEVYYECCGKSICRGCAYSFCESGNYKNCPYCKAERIGKTDDKKVEELMKRVVANDANSIYVLGNYYFGQLSLLRDRNKAMELWTQAAKLGSSEVHYELGIEFYDGGDLKKAKFHFEAAAMAGHEVARNNLGTMEAQSGNMERAVKHWTIAASAGHYIAMHNLIELFNHGFISRDEIESTLTAYNNSCSEMRSEARDAVIRIHVDS